MRLEEPERVARGPDAAAAAGRHGDGPYDSDGGNVSSTRDTAQRAAAVRYVSQWMPLNRASSAMAVASTNSGFREALGCHFLHSSRRQAPPDLDPILRSRVSPVS